MRRKSERTANKKSSPEKKVEKLKRTRTRRKQSTSSENESADAGSPLPEVKIVAEAEKKPPSTPVKEDSPEEAPDQVWQVKATEGSGDVGEIKKLKICLTRPPSTPERTDRSPRSKRKHSRATSSSDTPSVEAVEERKKSKHRSKRSTRESKDESDKNQDSQGDDEPSMVSELPKTSANEVAQSSVTHQVVVSDETPMSTTNEEVKTDDKEKSKETEQSTDSEQASEKKESNVDNMETDSQNKASDADTTVDSPKADTAEDQNSQTEIIPCKKRTRQLNRSLSEEMLEIHADESKISESSELNKTEEEVAKEEKPEDSIDKDSASKDAEVSNLGDKNDNIVTEVVESTQNNSINVINETDVVEGVKKKRNRNKSTDSDRNKHVEGSNEGNKSVDLECSDSTQSTQQDNVHNGQTPPIVISRKRKWGSRTSKLTSQMSITISTDVLKEIIPDVKPAEFDEVIEEKKHHRKVEMSERLERLERPVLPKIVIDNSENVEQHRKEHDNRDKENFKVKEPLGFNRKISIVNDNDNIIGRPPSPPRYKQSNILFITNLVRPFTLPQLKNLLQRTGRIKENGFWIDRIKSKCFVKYETEDQAVETRHALHGVTWPVSNPKALQVDFSTQEAFDKAKLNEDTDNAQASTIPGTVEDWLREQDQKRERGDPEKPWERKAAMREWDVGKNEKEKEKDKIRRDDRKRHRSPSPEPAKKFKKKEEEAPAKLLDDLFRKTKTTPCIYWLPLSAETIAIKEEQRRQHMAEHERRLHMQEFRRPHRRH